MLNLEQSPSNFSLFRNDLFYKAESDVRTVLTLTVNESAQSEDFIAYPDQNNRVRFQSGLADYIESQINTLLLPDVASDTEFDIQSGLIATLDAELTNGVDTPITLPQIRVVNAKGFTPDIATLPIFWYYQGPDMTLKYSQRFPVMFYIDTAITQAHQLRLRFNSTNYFINLTGLGLENVIDLSPESLETLFTVNLGTVKSYSIKIECESLDSLTFYNSEELFFNIEHRTYANTRTFAYKNTMGAIELLTCTGRRQERKTYTKEIAERVIYQDATQADVFYFVTDTEVTLTQATGILGKNAKQLHEYYQYFFESNQVFEIINDTYVPVLVEPIEYEYISDDLKLYGFTFQAKRLKRGDYIGLGYGFDDGFSSAFG